MVRSYTKDRGLIIKPLENKVRYLDEVKILDLLLEKDWQMI